MTYEQRKEIKLEDFKRRYGVNQGMFNRMVNVLYEQVEQKTRNLGLQAQTEHRRPGTNQFG